MSIIVKNKKSSWYLFTIFLRMNEIFVLGHLAVVFLKLILDLYRENQRKKIVEQSILSVSPANTE